MGYPEVVIMDKIPFKLEKEAVLKYLKLHGDSRRFENYINQIIEMVSPIARPKAVYRSCSLDEKNADYVVIDGIVFRSRLLSDVLEDSRQVFASVATCGVEVDALKAPSQDMMMAFCLDAVKNLLVFEAVNYVQEQISKRYGINNLSSLNPGEIELFPSIQQKNLFALLGDVEGMIGVKLTENCALIPTKSRSSLYFPSRSGFLSCRLCRQFRCPGRKAPFNAELLKKYQQVS